MIFAFSADAFWAQDCWRTIIAHNVNLENLISSVAVNSLIFLIVINTLKNADVKLESLSLLVLCSSFNSDDIVVCAWHHFIALFLI